MLVVKNLRVRYRGSKRYALEDVSFNAKPGELVLVVGRSGSGKTTLARTISGLIPFFYPAVVEGEVWLFDKNPVKEGISHLAGLIGFIGQDPEMFVTSLTVFEEIALPLINLGYPKDYIVRRVKEIAEKLGIMNLLNKLTPELSAGQLQIVSIASALSSDPKVLVLDEPVARLDKRSSRYIARILREIADENKLVLVFEHHLDEILPLADRVILLNNGKKIIEGEPRKVVNYLTDVDIPEITEAFYRSNLDELPLNVEEAVKYYDSIKEHMV